MRFFQGDIADASADVIANAANGIGFMGGFLGRFFKFAGVVTTVDRGT